MKVRVVVGVCDGVRVGISNVEVIVGPEKEGDKVADTPVSTNPAMTVSAAAVLISPGVCIVTVGTAQASNTIDKMTIVKGIRLESSIAPPNKF